MKEIGRTFSIDRAGMNSWKISLISVVGVDGDLKRQLGYDVRIFEVDANGNIEAVNNIRKRKSRLT